MQKRTVHLVVLFSYFFTSISGSFDCQSIEISSNKSCQSELKCIYDEAYEGLIISCKCKVVLNGLSFPENSLRNNLFEKVCSQRKENLQELTVNDAELEFFDNEILRKYSNLKVLKLSGNKMRLNFSEEAGRLVELDISSNGLNLLESDAFNYLKFLKIVNVSFNRLEEFRSLFNHSKELENIYLNNNRLTTIRNGFIHLQKLKLLNLARNFLTSFENNLLPTNVQELYLNNNKLRTVTKDQFQNLHNLRILNLAQNLISTLGNSPLLTNTEMNINNNNDGHIWSTFSKNLQRQNQEFAKQITSGQNSWNHRNFPWINRQKRQNANHKFFLTFGNVAQNPFLSQNQTAYGRTFANFGNLNQIPVSSTVWSKLQDLNLAENRIKSVPEAFFAGSGELTQLNISNNELTDFDLNQLGNSPKLVNFDIRNNYLMKIDFNLFKSKWALLNVVDVDLSLLKCNEVGDVLDYFKENGIVLKSCNTPRDCCGRILGRD